VNREAELERPSRVACSDLLGGIIVSNLISNDFVILKQLHHGIKPTIDNHKQRPYANNKEHQYNLEWHFEITKAKYSYD
jgi:hypothetical protein